MMEPWLAGDRAALDRIRSLPPAPPASWEASTAGIAQAAARSYSRGAGRLDEFKLAALAEKASAATGVDSSLIRGVIQTESAGDPQARSPKGALGLMQLMPGTARELGVDPSDPEQNVLGGARYLAALLKRFHGDERLALAGYNAGPGAVEKYDGIPPYAETRKYVDTVQAHRRRFAGGTP
ncbi:MAG: lytic transglycosylase domain-containing protein [Fibrobacteria bacterium]|nr:lytic transglycosylase domain-containing protein [Fibrobacteria bacterium]